MKNYLKRTWKNKLVALLLLLTGLVPIWLERDATILVLFFGIIVFLFFANRDYIGEVRHDE